MSKKETIQAIIDVLHIDDLNAVKIYEKAQAGGEFSTSEEAIEWFEHRFQPNLVWIEEDEYAKMCIDALKIVNKAAATDYGSSRQRDLGQHWADMTRGYLAEYALTEFLGKVWNISALLDHESGVLDDYLGTDVHLVRTPSDTEFRRPNISIGIKGTKWNGIWLDLPNQQIFHSDVHVLVKVGVNRDHLFAYFKHISVFKDKVLQKGIEVGALNQTEADTLFSLLPTFRPIPAYIAGFALRDAPYEALPYIGKRGKKHLTITHWRGEIRIGDLQRIIEKEDLPKGGQVKFVGIGKFSHESGYLFNVGNLHWQREAWQEYVINQL